MAVLMRGTNDDCLGSLLGMRLSSKKNFQEITSSSISML